MDFSKISIIITLFTALNYAAPLNQTDNQNSGSSESSWSSESLEELVPSIESNESGSREIEISAIVYDDNYADGEIIVCNDSNSDETIEVKREKRAVEDPARGKRALVFRPLFVYRQQEVRRQRLQEQRRTRPTKRRHSHAN